MSAVASLDMTRWPSLRQPTGEPVTVTWEDLGGWLAKPLSRRPKDKLPGWSPATFEGARRRLDAVREVALIVLDVDEGDVTQERLAEALKGWRAYVHSTPSFTPSAPRWRVVVATSRPMTGKEQPLVWNSVRQHLSSRGIVLDDHARDSSRLWFVPVEPLEGPYVFKQVDGVPLDVDALLVSAPQTPASTPASEVGTPGQGAVANISIGTRVRRARAWLQHAEPAISGNRGHGVTLRAATALIRGFALPEMEALSLLREWSARCEPPWSDVELRHKLEEATRIGAMAFGAKLLEREPPKEPEAKAPQSRPSTPVGPASVIRAVAEQGPIVRLVTGISTLDEACRGGLPTRRFVVFGGAPGAGKTSLAVFLAWTWAKQGIPTVILAVDEGVEGIAMRLAQLEGLDVQRLEERDADELTEAVARLDLLPIALLDGDEDGGTVENAAACLADYADGGPAVLVVDSIQTARAAGGSATESPRDRIDRVVRIMKAATLRHGFLTLATCELNRGSYRSKTAADQVNDLAAFKESGGIEYAAQTAFVLRSVADANDLVDVTVPKNRGFKRPDFRLKLNLRTTSLSEVEVPDLPSAPKQEGAKAAVTRDAALVAVQVARRPGINKTNLYTALRVEHGSFNEKRADAGLLRLGPALVTRPAPRNATHHYLDGSLVEPDVMAQLPVELRPGVARSNPKETL